MDWRLVTRQGVDVTYEKPGTMCRWGLVIEVAVGLHNLREDHRLVPIKRQAIPP